MRRNTLQFDPNVTYTLALKYETGREVSNGRIMFTTTEEECFFLDPEDAAKIHALGLRQNEPLEIQKRVTGSGKTKETGYLVRRAGAQTQQRPGIAPPAAAVHVDPPAPVVTPEQTTPVNATSKSNNSYTSILASSYIAAIDALRLAKDYADKHNVPFHITETAISTSAHSIFIQFHRSQEQRQKQQPATSQNGGAQQWQRQ